MELLANASRDRVFRLELTFSQCQGSDALHMDRNNNNNNNTLATLPPPTRQVHAVHVCVCVCVCVSITSRWFLLLLHALLGAPLALACQNQ